MTKSTSQMNEWSGDFGRDYTDRNPQTSKDMDARYVAAHGITRTELNKNFLDSMDRSIRILEIGANVGSQLQLLQEHGFENLYGIELQPYAVELAKQRTKNINIIQGSAFDVPFQTGWFDLVFTSGVLIHISPDDVNTAMAEIHRCSKRYIWGFEYYAEEFTEIPYRGNSSLMWKNDYAKTYLETFKDLKLVKKQDVPYLADDNVDQMFLLEKV